MLGVDVGGIAAAAVVVLTYCQTRCIADVLYSSYTNTRVPDKETMKSFLPILDLPPLRDFVPVIILLLL